MIEYKRTIGEVVAITKLEPGLKSIYVEGVSDYYLIKNYIDYHKLSGISVYEIDTVDFLDKYEGLAPDVVKCYVTNNKERVIFLASIIESEEQNDTLPIMCIVDRDWDFVNNNVRKGRYLYYTDYNSMDMYLFGEPIVEKYLKQGHRIKNVQIQPLLNSIATVGRQVFFIHLITNSFNETMVSNNKDFMFDKSTCTCAIDINGFWQKTMNKCGLTKQSAELKNIFNEKMASTAEVKMEIRGHDFVHYLFLCVKKLKTSISMDEEEFANIFWQYINLDDLAQESLFKKIHSL